MLFLGRLTSRKGPEFFLETASRVIAGKIPNLRFVVVGTGEKLRPLIESGAFRGLGAHFHFTGFLDKEKVIEQAKLDIAASTWDAAATKVMKVYEESIRFPP